MKSKADLHNHLRTSSRLYDEDFNKAIDLASYRLGHYGIFAMTNFSDKRYERFIGSRGYERVYLGEDKNGILVPEKNVLVVKGEEVPTKQGHILTLGLKANVHLKPDQSLEDTLKEAQDKAGSDGLVEIADHPFQNHGVGPYLMDHPDLTVFFDAFEVFNGETSLFHKVNVKAIESYLKLKQSYPFLGLLSSSDGHSFYELGRNWTEIDTPLIYPARDFVPSLKSAIRRTDLQTPQQQKTSKLGAIDHMIDLIWICKLAPKLGLGFLYKTEKPTFS